MTEDVRDKRGEGVRNGFQVSNLAIGWCHSQSLEIDSLKLAGEKHSEFLQREEPTEECESGDG